MPETIGSLTELSAWFDGLHGTRWRFRGISSHRYKLLPKIGRTDYSEAREQATFDLFREHARAHLAGHLEPRFDWEWLVLAQEHGLPTRLLDWTCSPYVAAFFAVESEEEREDAAICAFQSTRRVVLEKTPKQPFKVDEVAEVRPPHLSPRISPQVGTFTIHPRPAEEFKPDTLVRVVIPRDCCPSLKFRLSIAGVHRGTLFPDLDGISSYLSYLHTRAVASPTPDGPIVATTSASPFSPIKS